jgi:hypothetical protein
MFKYEGIKRRCKVTACKAHPATNMHFARLHYDLTAEIKAVLPKKLVNSQELTTEMRPINCFETTKRLTTFLKLLLLEISKDIRVSRIHRWSPSFSSALALH